MIIGMDDRNIEDLMERAPDLETEKKIHPMTDYCRKMVADYVPDPYYGGAQGSRTCLIFWKMLAPDRIVYFFNFRDN